MFYNTIYAGGRLSEESFVLKAIGKKVRFRYPEGAGLEGILKDRCVLCAPSMTSSADYCDVIDLIEFEHKGKRFETIRFGYYRRTKGKLRWASQTTLTEEIGMLKELFRKAVKQKAWFRRLLEDALKDT